MADSGGSSGDSGSPSTSRNANSSSGGGGSASSSGATPTLAAVTRPTLYVAGVTHPGVEHRENQDAFFVWRDTARGHVVTGVLDGHGRELGQTAAFAARDCFERNMPSLAANDFSAFRANPAAEFQRLFDAAHVAIREAFTKALQDAGMMTKWENNVLLKATPPGSRWQSVSGGTTCTVLVLLDARHLYVANVGDSDLLMCSTPADPARPEATARCLKVVDVSEFVAPTAAAAAAAAVGGGGGGAGAADGDKPTDTGSGADAGGSDGISSISGGSGDGSDGGSGGGSGGGDCATAAAAAAATSAADCESPPKKKQSVSRALATKPGVHFVECTAEHSAESISEFKRMRKFRPSLENPREPELRFLFDAFGYMKHSRPAVFKERVGEPGVFDNTKKGVYHKNVRAEFASLVCTPAHADFQDGLAFTRSLGDFYLHTFGVSSTVDVQCADLGVMGQPGTAGCLALCLCSDGVWDNWKFPDIVNELVSPNFLQGIAVEHTVSANHASPNYAPTGEAAVIRNAQRLMRLNHARATSNFGSSMDNMTLVLLYVAPPPAHGAVPAALAEATAVAAQ